MVDPLMRELRTTSLQARKEVLGTLTSQGLRNVGYSF